MFFIIISTCISSTSECEYNGNSHHCYLPVGLITQLVEHCSGITEVMHWNPGSSISYITAGDSKGVLVPPFHMKKRFNFFFI